LVLRPGLDGIVYGALIVGLDAVVVLRERRGEVLPPDHAAQLPEVLVGVGRDEDVPHLGLLRVLGVRTGRLAALDDPVRAELRVPVAPPLPADPVPPI